jgi:hypothetical protein
MRFLPPGEPQSPLVTEGRFLQKREARLLSLPVSGYSFDLACGAYSAEEFLYTDVMSVPSGLSGIQN